MLHVVALKTNSWYSKFEIFLTEDINIIYYTKGFSLEN